MDTPEKDVAAVEPHEYKAEPTAADPMAQYCAICKKPIFEHPGVFQSAEDQKLADVLQMKPQPIPPEKRTWQDYFERPVSAMLEEALEYVKTSVEHPEQLRGIVVLFNPSDLHKPLDQMTTSNFEVYIGRAKATDPEVVFLARYIEQDVWLHFIGVRT